MSNPVIHAFFVGRAIAEVLSERLENALTNTLSDLGKFDAQQRENLRKFTTEVMDRAEQEAGKRPENSNSTQRIAVDSPSGELQEMIDDLRAEVARLRSELKRYRTPSD